MLTDVLELFTITISVFPKRPSTAIIAPVTIRGTLRYTNSIERAITTGYKACTLLVCVYSFDTNV